MLLKAFMLCYDVSNKTLVYSVGGEAMKVHSWGLPVLYFVTTMAFTSCKKTKKKLFGYETNFHYTTYRLQ